jgi:hypothetical protein
MCRVFLALISLIFVNACLAKDVVQRKPENLPPLVAAFEIVDGNSNVDSLEKRLSVVVSPRVNEDDETNWIPKTIDQAIEELEAMLPREYFLLLMSQYVKGLATESKYANSSILRFKDELSQYLYGVWDIPESKLGEKLYCVGVLERDLSPFLVLAASKFAREHSSSLKFVFSKDVERFLEYKRKCEMMELN